MAKRQPPIGVAPYFRQKIRFNRKSKCHHLPNQSPTTSSLRRFRQEQAEKRATWHQDTPEMKCPNAVSRTAFPPPANNSSKDTPTSSHPSRPCVPPL